jgi:hypothetical protein
MEEIKEWGQAKEASERSFGLLFSIIAIGAAALAWYMNFFILSISLICASVSLLVAAYLFPKLLSPFLKAWMLFAMLLASILNPLIMGIIFFLAVWPTKAALLIFGDASTKNIAIDPTAVTYWVSRTNHTTDLRRQF